MTACWLWWDTVLHHIFDDLGWCTSKAGLTFGKHKNTFSFQYKNSNAVV